MSPPSSAASTRTTNPLSSDIVKRIQSRDVLYCAILLHDMAKGLPGDHSDVGAAIARSLCPRLGLSAADTAAVAWLVKNHLVMSDTAQRRDVSDPKTVRDFVEHGAVAGDAAPAADPDRGRHPRRRARACGTAGRASCCASFITPPRT